MLPEETSSLNPLLKNLPSSVKSGYSIHIDTFRHPYIQFDDTFIWPSIHTGEITEEQAEKIIHILTERIPGFIANCSIMPLPRPRKNSSQLHFIKKLYVNERPYTYQIRISAEYMGGANEDELLTSHGQGITPQFITNRIYYTARIFPSSGWDSFQGSITNFTPLQIKDAIFKISPIGTERDMWSTILFDDIDFSAVNEKFTEIFSFYGNKWIPGKLFFPFLIDHLTLNLNVIFPRPEILEKLVSMFDPLVVSVLEDTIDDIPDDIKKFWSDYYSNWDYTLAPARSGNPHWIVNKYYGNI